MPNHHNGGLDGRNLHPLTFLNSCVLPRKLIFFFHGHETEISFFPQESYQIFRPIWQFSNRSYVIWPNSLGQKKMFNKDHSLFLASNQRVRYVALVDANVEDIPQNGA